MQRIVDNLSIQGYSHILSDKECQDASISWQGKKYSAAIISDGHGGDKYFRSAKGSQIACVVGKQVISSFMESVRKNNLYDVFAQKSSKREEMLSQLELSVIQCWNEEVTTDVLAFPFEYDEKFAALNHPEREAVEKTPSKAYGATFIAAVVTDSFLFVLKLGDGNVCILNSGELQMFYGTSDELKDDNLQFNITTSLCGSDADKQFRHCFINLHNDKSFGGLILTTDGIINSYTSERAYLDFIGNIFCGYKEQRAKSAHAELAEFLPRLSEKGSGDDLSVGVIINKF